MERQKLFEYVYNKPLFPMRETTEIKEVPLDSNDQDVEQEEEIRITRPTQVKTKRKLDKKTIEEKQKMITLLLNRAGNCLYSNLTLKFRSKIYSWQI